MAKVGAQRAAVLTGRSKSTVQRAMNSGKLSYELDQNGRRVIDVSELERVFGIKQSSLQAAPQEKPASASGSATVETAVEKERMSMKIKMLEQQLQTANEYIDDLKDQRDKWEKQASQVLITSQYTQRQHEELREQIKRREERAKMRRQHLVDKAEKTTSRAAQDASSAKEPGKDLRRLDEQMKRLKAQNENDSVAQDGSENQSVFRFWKRAKG